MLLLKSYTWSLHNFQIKVKGKWPFQIICEQHKMEQKECMESYLHAFICLHGVFKYKENFILCLNITVDCNSFAYDEYLQTCCEKSINSFNQNSHKYTILVATLHEL